MTIPAAVKALRTQENWWNFTTGTCIEGLVQEYSLFSDSHIVGELVDSLGPYDFLNPVSIATGPGIVHSGIVLRIKVHLDTACPPISGSNTDFYHGGGFVDEIGALVSLCLGIRVRAGGEIRRFSPKDGPYGRPIGWDNAAPPVMQIRNRGLVLPEAFGRRNLTALMSLQSIPKIAPARYVNLIRAARFYQDALWVAESEPNLAWIMLVSALETAANDVISSTHTAEERLKTAKPKLVEIIEKVGCSEILPQIAEEISHTLGATKKFIDFVLNHMPNAPATRPETWLQCDWSRSGWKKILHKVYGYRSSALHGGIPFPAPMLDIPFRFSEKSAHAEKPIGLGAAALGGTWMAEDTPINLHCFHYVAHSSLLKWWQSLPELNVISQIDSTPSSP